MKKLLPLIIFLKLPFLILSLSSSASEEINLFTICKEDISREKIATGFSWSIDAFLIIDNTNAVLPIDGLPAIITKSEGCHPEVILSKSMKPDGHQLFHLSWTF
ncbi:MAG: hypothetical protein Ct9H90mP3_0150 [Flammeovirgaceae bacterium]|nr:MAG: hypothetical protein Ct9H90mP3_0150 [Flammeovirgaceae bacterium]